MNTFTHHNKKKSTIWFQQVKMSWYHSKMTISADKFTSVFVYVYICVYLCICVYVCICVCTFVFVQIYTYVYIYDIYNIYIYIIIMEQWWLIVQLKKVLRCDTTDFTCFCFEVKNLKTANISAYIYIYIYSKNRRRKYNLFNTK